MHKAIRIFLKTLSIIIAFAVMVSALALGTAVYFNSPPEMNLAPGESTLAGSDIGLDDNGNMLLEVKNGETAYSVGSRLENAGVIRNRFLWNLIFRFGSGYIKAGTYKIELPESLIKIRSILISGEQLLVKVTIPEGITLKKISQILDSSLICGEEEFLEAASSREILDAFHVPGDTMEGYLYPDTYFFNLKYPAERVVSVMAGNFFRRLDELVPGASSLNMNELNEKIIIASIVEREYRIPEEASVMAGVFYNRLKIGMSLQSCATVEYVITEIEGRPHPEILYNRDLEIKNPYNTYIKSGLPPGPISVPGETALKAAFFPSKTEYFYFRIVDPGEGRHYFSRTLDDHIRAGKIYTKGS